jgi:hypothetical protein
MKVSRRKAIGLLIALMVATIGRKAAVAKILWPFRANWSGFLAWLAWMGVHIFFLIGFRNRVSVFASWARTYIRLRDGVRLIVGSRELPGWDLLSKEPMSAPEPDVCPTPTQKDGGPGGPPTSKPMIEHLVRQDATER